MFCVALLKLDPLFLNSGIVLRKAPSTGDTGGFGFGGAANTVAGAEPLATPNTFKHIQLVFLRQMQNLSVSRHAAAAGRLAPQLGCTSGFSSVQPKLPAKQRPMNHTVTACRAKWLMGLMMGRPQQSQCRSFKQKARISWKEKDCELRAL